jgi:carbonic anhydrase
MAQSQIHREVLEANRTYAENFGDKGNLALPPARGFAILTCMDARLDPADRVRATTSAGSRSKISRKASPRT